MLEVWTSQQSFGVQVLCWIKRGKPKWRYSKCQVWRWQTRMRISAVDWLKQNWSYTLQLHRCKICNNMDKVCEALLRPKVVNSLGYFHDRLLGWANRWELIMLHAAVFLTVELEEVFLIRNRVLNKQSWQYIQSTPDSGGVDWIPSSYSTKCCKKGRLSLVFMLKSLVLIPLTILMGFYLQLFLEGLVILPLKIISHLFENHFLILKCSVQSIV